MIKYYGCYGFLYHPIVDCSIRLILWNDLQWRLYFFMNDWYYMFDFEHEYPFWQKKDKSIFPIVTPLLLHFIANFLMKCLDMPSKCFLAWRRKHCPTFLCEVLEVFVPSVPCRSTWKLMCFFSYCHKHPSDWTIVCKVLHVLFEWRLSIDMYYRRKFMFDEQSYWSRLGIFKKKYFGPKNCLRVWRGTEQ